MANTQQPQRRLSCLSSFTLTLMASNPQVSTETSGLIRSRTNKPKVVYSYSRMLQWPEWMCHTTCNCIMLSERSPEQKEHILYATITEKLQKVKIIYVKAPGMRVHWRSWNAGLGCENSLSTLWYRYFLRYMLCFDKKLKTFWAKGQERPFTDILVNTGRKNHEQFCLHGSKLLLTFLDSVL